MNKDVQKQRNGLIRGVEIFKKAEPSEGGWGWMVFLAMAICHAVYGIIVRAFGVTYIELLDRFNGSATATAWVGALNLLMIGLCCE